MRSLWGKIGLGAIGVFVVGMLLLTVARQAKSAVKSALQTAFADTSAGRCAGRRPAKCRSGSRVNSWA